MNAKEIIAFFWGGVVAGFFSVFLWGAVRYVVLTIKDRIKKRKAGNYTLAKNMKKGPPPKLISLDDDNNNVQH